MSRSIPWLRKLAAFKPEDQLSRRALTGRYALALAIIGTVLLGLQGLSILKAGRFESDGALINGSGLQRMLSQRVALLAGDLVTSTHVGLRQARFDSLSAALMRMEANHATLQADWRDRAAEDQPGFAALLDDGGIALRIDNFLILARSVLASHDRSEVDQLIARNTALSLAEIARGDFLQALDEVVKLYEQGNRRNMARLQSVGTLSVLFGLIVLVVVSLTIFQPMVNLVIRTIESLRESRDEQFELGRRMSHDLRAPIASSLGVVSIVGDALAEGDLEEARDANARLHGALTRLDDVLAQLMAVTRLHRKTLQLEWVDVGELMAEAFAGDDEPARVTVIDEIGRRVATDRELLRGILRTLFDNAVRYRRGRTAEIVVVARWVNGELQLAIEDAGIGIPESCRSRVFDMFQQFHPDRSQGTGLGLYRAKVCARTLGGRLMYEPLREGSRFALILPQRNPGQDSS